MNDLGIIFPSNCVRLCDGIATVVFVEFDMVCAAGESKEERLVMINGKSWYNRSGSC